MNHTLIIDFFSHRLRSVKIKQELVDWLIDWCLTSSEQFFNYIQDEKLEKCKIYGLDPINPAVADWSITQLCLNPWVR